MTGWLDRIFAAKRAPKPAAASLTSVPALWSPLSWDATIARMIELPDPDKVLRKLGHDRSELEKLLYDDEIYQCVQTREDGLQKVPIRLEPTEDEASRLIMSRCLRPETRRAIVRGAFKALLFGWSIMEIVWDEAAYKAEGVYVPKDVGERPIRNFTVRPDGTLVLNASSIGKMVEQRPELQKRLGDWAGGNWVVMDTDYKFLLTRSRHSWDNPYGEALLSRLYWPWFFRSSSWQFLGQYLERYAVGILVASLDKESSISADDLTEKLLKAQQDAALAIKGGTISVVNPNSSGHELYKNVEDMLVRRVQKVVLGQTLTSGTDGGSGNRALGEVHNEIRKDKTESDIGMILPTMQNYVNACFRLNGFAGEPPEVVFGDEVNLATERAQRDQILIQSGMVGGFSEAYMMDNYGFRPGEIIPYEGPPPRTEDIVVEDEGEDESGEEAGEEGEKSEKSGKDGKNEKSGRMSQAGGGALRLAAGLNSSELALEALALWSGLRAGSPMAANRVKAAIRESQTPYELVDRISSLQEDLKPKFGVETLDADETALSKGRLDAGRR